jgi:LysM repeat protein
MTGQRRIACNLLLLALAMLPACSFMYPSKPYMPSRSGIQSGGTITVKPNENIYAIAREHNVSMRDLIVLNNLKPPYEVSPGQRLELPSGGTSFSGDTAPAPAAAPLGAVEKNELAPIEPASVSSESLEPIASQPSSSDCCASDKAGRTSAGSQSSNACTKANGDYHDRTDDRGRCRS